MLMDFKDVDGFHPANFGRMAQGLPAYLPATPFGIMQMLDRYNIDVEGKECVVLGRSNIVGTPISILLSRKARPGNATVSLCHSRTKDLKSHTLRADIIIAAIGIPEFLTADMVKDGVVIIDVGINRVNDENTKRGYRLAGDVKYEEVAAKASYITPVPGYHPSSWRSWANDGNFFIDEYIEIMSRRSLREIVN